MIKRLFFFIPIDILGKPSFILLSLSSVFRHAVIIVRTPEDTESPNYDIAAFIVPCFAVLCLCLVELPLPVGAGRFSKQRISGC